MNNKGLVNLLAIIVHGFGFLIYLYCLYFAGLKTDVYAKACMYLLMACMHLYLVIDEWSGHRNYKQLQFNTINKSIFIINFTLIAATIFRLCDGVSMMIMYLAAVLLTTILILNSGLQHDYFKDDE